MYPRSHAGATSLIVILLASCGGDGAGGSSGVIVRDSAGVRIVENDAPLLDAEQCWTVGPEATVTIGEIDGPPEYLFQAPWAARLSDGRVIVLDRGNKELRFFSRSGEYLGSSGHEGEGPGEFRGPASVHVVAGDTLVIWDGVLRRLSVLDAAGTLARLVDLKGPEPIQLALGVVTTHTMMGRRLLASSDSAGLYISRSEVLLVSGDGDTQIVLDTIQEPRYTGERLFTGLPFAPAPFLVAGAGRAFVTHGAPYEVFIFDQDGSLEQIVRRSWTAEPVTEEDIQAFLEWTLSHGNRERQKQFLEANEEASRLSRVKPAIRWMVPDRRGNLWVGRWTGFGSTLADYDVFDTDGRWLCMVTLPMELRMITDIGEDYVLGLVVDDLGVERISMYPIHRKPNS